MGGRPVPEGGCLSEARRRLKEGVPTAPGAGFDELDRELYLTATCRGSQCGAQFACGQAWSSHARQASEQDFNAERPSVNRDPANS